MVTSLRSIDMPFIIINLLKKWHYPGEKMTCCFRMILFWNIRLIYKIAMWNQEIQKDKLWIYFKQLNEWYSCPKPFTERSGRCTISNKIANTPRTQATPECLNLFWWIFSTFCWKSKKVTMPECWSFVVMGWEQQKKIWRSGVAKMFGGSKQILGCAKNL